jgi:hypothetical protein
VADTGTARGWSAATTGGWERRGMALLLSWPAMELGTPPVDAGRPHVLAASAPAAGNRGSAGACRWGISQGDAGRGRRSGEGRDRRRGEGWGRGTEEHSIVGAGAYLDGGARLHGRQAVGGWEVGCAGGRR